MPIPTLLKKAASSIKRDRKDVRAVMTVNESQAPANPNINISQKYLDLKKNLSWKEVAKEFNKINPDLKPSDLTKDFIRKLNDDELDALYYGAGYSNRKFNKSSPWKIIVNEQYLRESKAYVEKLKNSVFQKHKLTEEYLQKLEDKGEGAERSKILRGLTNGGEDTEKLPLNEKFYKIINRLEGRNFFNDLIHLSEKEKEQFANYFFENKEKANPIIDYRTGEKRTVRYYDFEKLEDRIFETIHHSYLPKNLMKKIDTINEFGDNLWENASNLVRRSAYNKNLDEYDGKENTYEVLNRIRKKYPLITKFEDDGIDGIVKKTPDKSQIVSSINESYKLISKMNGILKNELSDYKKENEFRFYDELSSTEKNALRDSR